MQRISAFPPTSMKTTGFSGSVKRNLCNPVNRIENLLPSAQSEQERIRVHLVVAQSSVYAL